MCIDFANLKAFTIVYCANVRSHLEYASVVWCPSLITKVDAMESVQKRFVMYALRRSVRRDINYRSSDENASTLRLLLDVG